MNEESLVHKGHRQRMRNKFIRHTARAFDTYELLEMLLYHVIPCKDTNPISKRLLEAFGSLEGVFLAGREELLSVEGVGEVCADFLLSIGALINRGEEPHKSHEPCYDDYTRVGKYLVEYFRGSNKSSVAIMLFDNRMNRIHTQFLYDTDYDSATVRPGAFIECALLNRAVIAITAHNHPYGPLFPTVGDMQTNKMIEDALAGAGVNLAEHYVIVGERFVGIMNILQNAFAQSAEIERFVKSKKEAKL